MPLIKKIKNDIKNTSSATNLRYKSPEPEKGKKMFPSIEKKKETIEVK